MLYRFIMFTCLWSSYAGTITIDISPTQPPHSSKKNGPSFSGSHPSSHYINQPTFDILRMAAALVHPGQPWHLGERTLQLQQKTVASSDEMGPHIYHKAPDVFPSERFETEKKPQIGQAKTQRIQKLLVNEHFCCRLVWLPWQAIPDSYQDMIGPQPHFMASFLAEEWGAAAARCFLVLVLAWSWTLSLR